MAGIRVTLCPPSCYFEDLYWLYYSTPYVPYFDGTITAPGKEIPAVRRECEGPESETAGFRLAHPFMHGSSLVRIPQDDSAILGGAGEVLSIWGNNQGQNSVVVTHGEFRQP